MEEVKQILGSLDEIKDQAKANKDAVEQKLSAVEKELKEAKEKNADLEKSIEAIQTNVKEVKSRQASAQMAKTFAGELGEKLAQKADALKNLRESKKGFTIDMETKVVGNMGSSASLTGSYFVTPTVVPGVSVLPYETAHVRDLIPGGNTNSNVVRFVTDENGEGGPAMTAEAALKPQEDRDLQIRDANVRKIATYFRIPEEMIEDIPYLQSFISQIGVEEMMVVEDNQLLYGDGTGQNLTGFNTRSTAFAAGTSVIGASANQWDVIGAAKKQLRVARYGGPLVALINPTDYFNMTYRKDTTNNYLFQANQGTPIQRDGVTYIEHTAVAEGGFFVFSPRAAQVFDRAGTSVRFYDQDQDNAIRNLITVVIEKRLTLAIYYPGAIIRGTFATAITDLTS